MKRLLFFLIVLLLSWEIYSQEFTSSLTLPNSIEESSGLLLLSDKLVTHNDSGDQPILYEVDPSSGNIIRQLTISNASNTDWEDIAMDENFIFIADFGNNLGSRTDLKIYRILKTDYLNPANTSVAAEVINFSYEDQVDFTPSQYSTNFDAEALITWNDHLYIFTKNWGNFRTNIYKIPKLPGTYVAEQIDDFDSQGMITGGVYNPVSNSILLTGYTYLDPFIIEISNFTSEEFSGGNINRTVVQMPADYSYQIEGIAPIDQSQYYISSEDHFSGNSGLFTFQTEDTLGLPESSNDQIKIYPNPSAEILFLQSDSDLKVQIYDVNGRLVFQSGDKEINISNFSKGFYNLIITNPINHSTTSHKFVKK